MTLWFIPETGQTVSAAGYPSIGSCGVDMTGRTAFAVARPRGTDELFEATGEAEGEWVPDVAAIRARKKADATAHGEALAAGGYVSAIGPVATGLRYQLEMLGGVVSAMLAGQNQQPFSRDWPLLDGSLEPLDGTAMALFASEVGGWVASVWDHERALHAAIDAAEGEDAAATAALLAAIDVTAGWPASGL